MAASTRTFPYAYLLDSANVVRRLRLAAALACLVLGLTACSDAADQSANESAEPADRSASAVQPAAETKQPAAVSAELTAARMGQWTRNCALCHVRGEGGAPVVGDREAWLPRLEQGEELLLQHTVEGINNMPPLGYCMDCETADFLALIRFMGGEA